jgi:hypothetical protein
VPPFFEIAIISTHKHLTCSGDSMSIFYYIKHFLVKPEVRLGFLQNKLGPLAKLFDWSGWKGIEPFNIDLDSQSNTILLHPRPIWGKILQDRWGIYKIQTLTSNSSIFLIKTSAITCCPSTLMLLGNRISRYFFSNSGRSYETMPLVNLNQCGICSLIGK